MEVYRNQKYWLHGDTCGHKIENWLDEDEDPYCSWDIEKRLEDDKDAKPSTCRGGWVAILTLDGWGDTP